MTALEQIRAFAEKLRDETHIYGEAGGYIALTKAEVAKDLLALLDSLPAPTSTVALTDATGKRIKLAIERYTGATVAGELAYARDAGPSSLRRHDEQAKLAWAALDAELGKLSEAGS